MPVTIPPLGAALLSARSLRRPWTEGCWSIPNDSRQTAGMHPQCSQEGPSRLKTLEMWQVPYTSLSQIVPTGSHSQKTEPRKHCGLSDPCCVHTRTQQSGQSCPAFPLALPSASHTDWLQVLSLSLSWLGEPFTFQMTAPYYMRRQPVTSNIISPLWLAFCGSVCLKNARKAVLAPIRWGSEQGG